jgi:glyoxylase-like metal-dependent hydrolase (beta-lactamase superfamily II)
LCPVTASLHGYARRVIVAAFADQVFGTNCYVVAPAEGEECLVVDPGIDVLDTLAAVLDEHRLRPAAVLLTHGHLDHVYSVTPVCSQSSAPAYIHPGDLYRLSDPWAVMGAGLREMLQAQFGALSTWAEPDDVRELVPGGALEIAGLTIDVTHAPGHTEGSVMFGLAGVPDGVVVKAERTVLSGDVLFAGSIGRTDLPGGDHAAMLRSLRETVLTLPDDTLVLPGHGEATTIGRERTTNPYLQQVAATR